MLIFTCLLSAALADKPENPSLDGVYIYVPSKDDAQMVNKQLEKSLAEMNPVFRHFARSRLQRGAAIDSKIELKMKNQKVTLIHYNQLEKAVLTVPINKKVRSQQESGLTHKVDYTSHQLNRMDRTSQGGRSVVYKLSKDGKTLLVKFQFFSKYIPKPVKYTLKYVKNLVDKP